jgi:hypothetical protein
LIEKNKRRTRNRVRFRLKADSSCRKDYKFTLII